MNAVEIRNLSKSFRGMYAVDSLCMTVPVGAIYGFIGENGSGKSTMEKLTIMNVVLCLAGGVMLGTGLGVISNQVLKKTSLV